MAFVLDFALDFLGTRFLPAGWQVLTLHGNSVIQPSSCMASAVSLCIGGWIGGRRFLPIGVALVLLLQLVALTVLTRISHGAMPQRPVSSITTSVLSSNVLSFGLQLLAAALGAMFGAALYARRPLSSEPIRKSA